MNSLDSQRVTRDAQRDAATGPATPSAYGEAVNRYLGAFGYLDRVPAQSHHAAPADTGPPTGRPLVVVGVHDSPASAIAVDHAGIEAELRGADLRMVLIQAAMHDQSTERERGESLLAHLVRRVHAGTRQVTATSRLLIGAPAPLLLDEANDADLVVVGSEHGHISDAAGSSVSAHLAAHHRGPVMVVRLPAWPTGADFAARPIIVGVDGPGSTAAVAFGIEEARLRGCELVLLHAGAETFEPETAAVTAAMSLGMTVHRRTVQGPAGVALTEAALYAAAVVVGSHGRTGLPRLLLGSVGQQLIHQANCPVFIVQ